MKWSKGKVEKNWGEICVVNVFLTMLYVKILTLTFYTLKKNKNFSILLESGVFLFFR